MATNNRVDPQKAAQISGLIAGLLAQYPGSDVTAKQAEHLFAAYVDDLVEYTVYDVEEAIRAYRRDAKNKFRPTSGQLRSLASQACKDRIRAQTQHPIKQDSRPLMWWRLPRHMWKAHWSEYEVPEGDRPSERVT